MAKKKEEAKEAVQGLLHQEEPQGKKDDRFIYAGPTIINERFYLRQGQIFTQIPPYAPDELKAFFIPVAEYSPEKEKELEKKRKEYLKKNKGAK